ncbi:MULTISPECIES: acyl--CoA ligase [unclassified Ruegeria]|uniref:acyl--CoA ligase n=1 Tax=unclassified Ruegeria TaxID=2625375 RepID=UPI0014896E1E|nr:MULTISPECIES: acyl--CoA ligase [unclassified Ruegeria]NOD75922.1 AMP-binding protein [Ruegeria sp. HKCCD4332]NOD88780.1 AMP-binding protein [Ruegeria sp. HKCCD4318]NOE16175.1 AMP-binding protein [Ruegeria sp. HKCCD4318-2]NOG09845.1 AMP-binding protein [Ruegeria sp. HKCCD4315]
MPHLVAELIAHHADTANAIGAPGQPWLSYLGLREHCAKVKEDLHQIGIGRGDRVAIVLPNGPEMATAFISVAQVATTAPLNPSYTAEEYVFYLRDLKAKALVVSENECGPAVQAATELGVAVLRISSDSSRPAGQFSVLACDPIGVADTSAPGEDDVALILHTSGTTSRPKIVPLTQANIYSSARNVASSLKLTIDDRCLSIMPLFHIHGLIAAVAASLGAGSQISCASGFNALSFFSQVAEVDPTWYTAVPTMHQAILARAARNQSVIEQSRLRFLRSSSASLPAPVMEELVATFNAPVIEAYGMTEATHQMCCNPLPPQKQKPGYVGVAAGPEVRIADETENVLIASRDVGEIVISGPNVTPGYESNPQVNADNFFEADGKLWFRTGDQGSFDEEDYLRLTGRLKELINRGGEKISPLEVDAVLLSHPDVAQAVCFAVPHEKLGEDIAAAVVLSEGATIAGQDVRDFVGARLAKFKVPTSVVILEEIPKGATGKIQRIGLAAKLGLAKA